MIFNKTGLLIDSYFSGTKIKWILDNVPKAKKLMSSNQLLFGTIDSFLIWRFTKGKVHATDATNASRTMIYNISSNKWDDTILNLLKIKKHILPEVKDCADDFGQTHSSITGKPIPINGVVGDQQSATIGQCCFEPGSLKSTYGTGCFLMTNTGTKPSFNDSGLLTTIGYSINEDVIYALEGSIYSAGTIIQWLRDNLEFFTDSFDSEGLINENADSNGVKFIPAFNGLGAPYWNSDIRASFHGITRDTNKNDLTTAAFNSIAYQTLDIVNLLKKMNVDPALASSVFVTTITDVIGFLSFLGVGAFFFYN